MMARGTLRRRHLRQKFLRRIRNRPFFLVSNHGRIVIDTLEEATGAGFKDAMTAVYTRLGLFSSVVKPWKHGVLEYRGLGSDKKIPK